MTIHPQVRYFLRVFWVTTVRGTPWTVIAWAIPMTVCLVARDYTLGSMDAVFLLLNLIAYDYRKRHGTLPRNGWDDDRDDYMPPPPA